MLGYPLTISKHPVHKKQKIFLKLNAVLYYIANKIVSFYIYMAKWLNLHPFYFVKQWRHHTKNFSPLYFTS